jgi:hypothetical protein
MEAAVAAGKGTKKQEKKQTIEQYCSVCKQSFDMEVVDGDDGADVLWLKCPGCEGYLPYMTGDDDLGDDADHDDQEAAEAVDLAPEDIDKDQAREYSESDEYQIDDIVYHRSWNDYGRVIAKETLPGNRKTIVVHFINQGKIRLLEGVT